MKKNVAAFALFLAFACAASAAASDMDIRDKWAKSVGAVKKGECGNEPAAVLEALSKAAALIMHGELDDARDSIKKAASGARSDACQKALKKVESP